MKYKVKVWKYQLGQAITLPTPWGVRVYVKSTAAWTPRLRAHEEVHVGQLARMGWLRYLTTHIWARIVTLNIWGIGHWIEDTAYGAETEV